MSKRRSPARARKTTRRWHIPPPLIHGSEALEGGEVLEEVRGEVGAVLWHSLRDVLLWAGTAPAERGALFSAGAQDRRVAALLAAELEEDVEGALQTVARVLDAPTAVGSEVVGLACRHVATWAEAEGLFATALAYAQAAALTLPGDPAAAFAVGTLAARQADHARAEVWFRRTIGLARQARDWRMYSRAFSGLGNLYVRRGNFPAAHRLHVRALRGARRGGLRHEQAGALHDLFGIAIETGRIEQAEHYAREAFHAYGPNHPRIPALAHDVGYFWMEQGQFHRALPVFQALVPVFTTPRDRIFALADLSRAAGGTGDRETAQRTAREVWALAEDPDVRSSTGRALLEVARGMASLGDLPRAEAAAREALRVSEERGEGKVRLMAEALLGSLDARKAGAEPQPRPASSPASDELAADLVHTLEAMAPAAS